MDEERLLKILKGRLDDLPKESSKTVRIFLSSTFTDTHAERDYLIQHIYPRLKKETKLKYGLDFQILDMRWGISSEATNTHMTTTICLKEIRTCQQLSCGPNFIVLLGDRYGTRSLPTRIKKDEFEAMKAALQKHIYEIDFSFELLSNVEELKISNLLDCYQIDENEKPARYKLRHIKSIIPRYDPKDPAWQNVWKEVENKLSIVLRTLADLCLQEGPFVPKQRNRFFVSVTEKEVFNGIIERGVEEVQNNVLVFTREIENVKENIEADKSIAWRFIDVDGENKIDQPAQDLLQKLKNKIHEHVPKNNIFEFKVRWAKGSGVSLESHQDYLKQFGETFYDQVKRLIDRNQQKASLYSKIDEKDVELVKEVLEHAYFANECVDKFHARNNLRTQIRSYILDNDSMNADGPLILFGNSGCGKTAILAKTTSEILSYVPDPKSYSIVLRFLGTTPTTSSMIGTLKSVIHQITRIYNLSNNLNVSKMTNDIEKLRENFQDVLINMSKDHPDKKLIIVLDSIDQLNASDYSLNWLPEKFPPNVKIILSTLPNHGNILENFRARKNLKEGNFLEINHLDRQTAIEIIDDWLVKAKRSLLPNQREYIQELLEKANTRVYPLYIRLIFDIVVKWESYFNPHNDRELKWCLDIDRCIEYLFNQLEKDHGRYLFSRAVTYMSAFQNGISESELVDILSLDDSVLFEIFQFHEPPVRRLPEALWSRIKHDLRAYLVEKEVDDTNVLYWYHRRFIEVADNVYLNNIRLEDRQEIFTNVVDLFNETYKHKPKPYVYNDYLMKKKKLTSKNAEAIRDTSIQPTVFAENNGIFRYNKRKIRELPRFVLKLSRSMALELSCQHIIFNYYFLHGMFLNVDITEILEYFKILTEGSTYRLSNEALHCLLSIQLLQLIVQQNIVLMKDYPNAIGHIILAQALEFNNNLKYFTKLISESDQFSSLNCILTTPYQQKESVLLESPLVLCLEKHKRPIVKASIGGSNDEYLFTLSDKLVLINLKNLNELHEVKLNPRRDSYDDLIVYSGDNFDTRSGQLKNLNGGFVLKSKREIASYLIDGTVKFCEMLEQEILDMFLVTPNHVLVAYVNAKFYDIFNIKSGEKSRRELDSEVRRIAATSFKELVNNITTMENVGASYVAFALKQGLVKIFKIDFSGKHQGSNDGYNFELMKLPLRSKSECIDLKFIVAEPKKYRFGGLFASFDDGSFIYHDLIRTASNKLGEIQPYSLFTQIVGSVRLKFLECTSNGSLFLDSIGNIYWQSSANSTNSPNQLKVIRIQGPFDSARAYRNKVIIGFSKGFARYFYIDLAKNQAAEIFSYRVHYDDVVFSYVKNAYLLTASKDGSIKIFNAPRNEPSAGKFDKVDSAITNIVELDSGHVVSQSSGSDVRIWRLSSGKILNKMNIEVADEKTKGIYVIDKDQIIVVNACSKANKLRNFTIRGFKIEGYDFKENFALSVKNVRKIKLFPLIKNKNDVHDFILLTYISDDACGLQIDYLSLKNQISSSPQELNLKSETNKIQLFPTKNDNQSTILRLKYVLNNAILLQFAESASKIKSRFFCFFHDEKLIVYDPENKTVMCETPVKMHGNSINPKCFTDSNMLVAMDNSNELYLFGYDSNANRIKSVSSANSDLRLSNLLEISKNAGSCSIMVHDKARKCIFVCDMNTVLKMSSFVRGAKYVNLGDSELNSFGFSADSSFFYTIQNSKILKLYPLSSKMDVIAEIPLYSIPECINCTDDYISLAMQDKRIISFLITDPNVDSYWQEKISRLESRKRKLEEPQDEYNTLLQAKLERRSKIQDNEYFADMIANDKENQIKKIQLIPVFNSMKNVKLNSQLMTDKRQEATIKAAKKKQSRRIAENDKTGKDQDLKKPSRVCVLL